MKAIVGIGIMAAIAIALFVGPMRETREVQFGSGYRSLGQGWSGEPSQGLIEGNTIPIFEQIAMPKAMNYRHNPSYGKPAKDASEYGGMSL